MKNTKRKRSHPSGAAGKVKATTLRIIGGQMGGRKIRYNGDRTTRPMRDSVRENLFNLVGPRIRDAIVFDPFCGTGVLVAEAFSRGAARAVAMEYNRRTIKQIQENLTELEVVDRTTLIPGDAFRGLGAAMHRVHDEQPESSWVFFLSPPYEMFESRIDDLNRMIRYTAEVHSDGVLIAECDSHFDATGLTEADWDVRRYGITQLAVASLDSIAIQAPNR